MCTDPAEWSRQIWRYNNSPPYVTVKYGCHSIALTQRVKKLQKETRFPFLNSLMQNHLEVSSPGWWPCGMQVSIDSFIIKITQINLWTKWICEANVEVQNYFLSSTIMMKSLWKACSNTLFAALCTGMLKDYLRELPEPLFTNKLCGELLDTFSSRSLEDPVCNGELLQNMIESLPPSNKVS